MSMDYDVIIVGARVAGSVLATLLGQHGHRVLLLERARFPSDTLSTHFFRAPAFQAFERMGVFDSVQRTAPHLINSFNDVDGHVFTEPAEGANGFNYCLCVRRITLDAILAERVRCEPTVELHEGAGVDALIWDGGHVVGVHGRERGRGFEARAKVVIGADGFYSQVARQVNPVVEEAEPVNRAMYYAYYQGLEGQPEPAAEFHFRGNHLVYVFPTDGGLTLVAASVPIAEFDGFRQDPDGQLTAELEALPTLAPRLRRAERVGPVRGAGNIPGYMRVPFGPGWALVGDAGQVLDPWSGQGIDQATTHATLLADALHAWLSEQLPWGQALAQYHQSRNAFSLQTYRRTCTYGRDLRPMTQAALRRRGLIDARPMPV
jgi:flavin-dependent dehydrogenase